jgi:NADH:ubiquinone oxidoreductase subunit E
MEDKLTISLCMGSSCFTRGNNRGITLLQKYIRSNGLEERVLLKGHLCEEKCQTGPIMKVGDRVYQNVDTRAVIDILLHHLQLMEEK